jgi:hypothetical protein
MVVSDPDAEADSWSIKEMAKLTEQRSNCKAYYDQIRGQLFIVGG